MKNTVTNYLNKVSNNQIKSVVDKKQFIIIEALYENAMEELKKTYWYEKELLIAIPMLLSNARTFELVDSLTILSQHTKEHIDFLEKQFPEISQIASEKRTYHTVTYKNVV